MTEQKIRTFEHAIADAMVRIRALIDEYAGWGPRRSAKEWTRSRGFIEADLNHDHHSQPQGGAR